MKKTLLLLGWCFALSAQATEFKGCGDFSRASGLPDNHMFSAEELQALEGESRKQKDIAWPAVLGLMHICGFGMVKDEEKGLQILQSSGREGEISSLLIEAGFYAGAFGGKVDSARLIEVLRYPASAGKLEAQLALAELYARGRFIPRNTVEAERWYLKAASQGNAEAQAALGRMYFFLHRDRDALPWLRMAAVQGKQEAKFQFNELTKAAEAGYLSLERKEPKPPFVETSSATAQADKQLEQSLRKAVLDGKPESKLALAAFLELTEWDQPRLVEVGGASEGTLKYRDASESVEQRMRERNKEAVEWLNKAAQQGNSTALYKLGASNWYGALGLSDEQEGLRMIRYAAAMGHADAIFWLARAYQQGTGLPRSQVAAYALYFHFEQIQSDGASQLASFVPPLEVSLREQDLPKARQLALALASPGQFLSVLDSAVAGEGR
jgi:TPR repeat protein